MVSKTVSKCQRCSKETHYLEVCNYCDKPICRSCQKSARTATSASGKKERLVICKTCWGKMPVRKTFLRPLRA
ncbi:MAG: hypothetical protein V1722_05745 [Candidatus Micrarchaeota archaeon]